MARQPRTPLDFPITEIFGYPPSARTSEAQQAQAGRLCPFARNECEKFRQYGYGNCSVSYAAQADNGQRKTYAVCDHRLDGPPIQAVLDDYFGAGVSTRIASEVVLTQPRVSFDYVAFTEGGGAIDNVVAIETQAIDLRGGGVGPAFQAWLDGKPDEWRFYFTREAERKKRKDNIAYGVNMGNIYKRLGLQAAEKGTYLKSIGVKLYVVMQDLPYQYLKNRIRFEKAASDWDIAFLTFEYTGRIAQDEKLEFSHCRTERTTLDSYVGAMAANNRMGESLRDDFLKQVRLKAGGSQADLEIEDQDSRPFGLLSDDT